MSLQNIADKKVQYVHHGKWLSFGHINYIDPVLNQTHQWEFVTRNLRDTRSIDSVDMLAVIKSNFKEDQILLVTQYRPAAQKIFIEFPAGLIDDEEASVDAASRELFEETGYTTKTFVHLSPTLYYDPGLSDSTCQFIHVEIDGDQNCDIDSSSNSCKENDEWSLESITLPNNGQLLSRLLEISKNKDYSIDSKLYTYAYALQLTSRR